MKRGDFDINIGYYHSNKHPTGSRYICAPPPTDTDIDILVLVNLTNWHTFYNHLNSIGFSPNKEDYAFDGESIEKEFVSFRRGEENIIATTSNRFFNLFVEATELAKRLNLLNKEDRISLFKSIVK